MELIKNWAEVVRKAWSIRLILLAGLLSGVEVILPFFVGNMPRGLFAGLSLVSTASAFVARLVAQKALNNEPEAEDKT